MPQIDLTLTSDGDGVWPDLQERLAKPCTTGEADRLHVAGLAAGMTSGKPSVTLRLDFADGLSRVAQTSLALFLTAAEALRAAYGDPRA
jgi:hypothetical protein